MKSGKFWATGAATLAVLAIAPSAFAADQLIITPGYAADKTVTYQQAAPTRMFNVEKATTLRQGENRFGANLQVGGLGVGGSTPGIAGGANIRADMGISPGLEAGLSVSGLGAAGVSNLLGNVDLRGKVALSEFSLGAMPVEVGGMANVGGFLAGGGIGSATVGVGIPLTAAVSNRLNVTAVPGLAFGFGAGGLLPGGAAPTVNAGGLMPALGLGLDWMVTDRLSGIVDANMNLGAGTTLGGNVGLRYGISDDLAADLFVGYNGSPLQAVNSGTIGLGGYYAF
jgi:hypothetical protein